VRHAWLRIIINVVYFSWPVTQAMVLEAIAVSVESGSDSDHQGKNGRLHQGSYQEATRAVEYRTSRTQVYGDANMWTGLVDLPLSGGAS
jgi:hypothetical protein